MFDSSHSSDVNFPQDTALSLSPHSIVFLLQTKRENYKSKNYTTLEQDYGFKKI